MTKRIALLVAVASIGLTGASNCANAAPFNRLVSVSIRSPAIQPKITAPVRHDRVNKLRYIGYYTGGG